MKVDRIRFIHWTLAIGSVSCGRAATPPPHVVMLPNESEPRSEAPVRDAPTETNPVVATDLAESETEAVEEVAPEEAAVDTTGLGDSCGE